MERPSKKSSLVGVRFSPEEKEKLKELAAGQKKNLSEMLRGMVLKQMERTSHKIVPEVNRRVYFELGKVSEQLETSGMNPGTLNDLQELLNEIRRELVGIAP